MLETQRLNQLRSIAKAMFMSEVLHRQATFRLQQMQSSLLVEPVHAPDGMVLLPNSIQPDRHWCTQLSLEAQASERRSLNWLWHRGRSLSRELHKTRRFQCHLQLSIAQWDHATSRGSANLIILPASIQLSPEVPAWSFPRSF